MVLVLRQAGRVLVLRQSGRGTSLAAGRSWY
jgi:hypothetical protein